MRQIKIYDSILRIAKPLKKVVSPVFWIVVLIGCAITLAIIFHGHDVLKWVKGLLKM